MPLQATNDTAKNYTLLEELIVENDVSGADVLQMFANIYGLQLLSKENTNDLIQELGYDIEEEEDDDEEDDDE